MKKYCLHTHGYPFCINEDFAAAITGYVPSVTIQKPLISQAKQKPTPQPTPRPEHHVHDHIHNYLKGNVDDEHHDDVKKVLHPFFVDNITKPSATEVPQDIQEFAMMNQAAKRYYRGELLGNEEAVEQFFDDTKLSDKYIVDYELSDKNGLVVVNKNDGSAHIALRGSIVNNRRDWVQNAKLFVDTKGTSDYYAEIEQLYDNAIKQYDIKSITGYSKGGNGAIYLGNKFGVETTVFNPYVTANAFINNNPNVIHNIWSTTDDFASVLAPPLTVGKDNIKYNSIDPLIENIGPYGSHKLGNFVGNGGRSAGRGHVLVNQFHNLNKIREEFYNSRMANEVINEGGSFTDFVKKLNPNDVNVLDNSLSKRVMGNGLLHKAWVEQGGSLTRLEQTHLTFGEQANYRFASNRTDRLDHVNAPNNIRTRQTVELDNQIVNTHSQLSEEVQTKSLGHQVNEGLRFMGVTPAGLGAIAVGAAAGTVVQQTTGGPDELGAAVGGGVTGALLRGPIAASAGGTVLSMEAGKVAGAGARELAKALGASEEVQKHADIIAGGSVGLATLPHATGIASKVAGKGAQLAAKAAGRTFLAGAAESLMSFGVAAEASPLPIVPLKVLGLMAFAGAGIAEAVNFFTSSFSSSENQEAEQQQTQQQETQQQPQQQETQQP